MKTTRKTILTDYQKMAKPKEIEEIWDLYLIRPAGFLLVQVFRRARITPNMVSFLSVLAAWWCSYLLYKTCIAGNDLTLSLWAAFAMSLHSTLDSADGQLARVTGQGSPLGRTIDGFCDNLSFIAIYLAIIFGYCSYVGEFRLDILLLAIISGVSHSTQSALADFQRCLFLYHVYGKADIEKESKASFQEALKKDISFFDRVLIHLHMHYIKGQHTFCGSSEKLKKEICSLLKEKKVDQKTVSLAYAKFQTKMLKGWALLASNSHKIGLLAAAFIPVGADSFFGEFGLIWFFIYEFILLNICMLLLILKQKTINHNILSHLKGASHRDNLYIRS